MITAIYARQSLEKRDSLSIETQIEFCRREVLVGEEVEVYTDEGYSGKNTNRPAFQQMMQKIKKNEINKVVVYKLDRISRSVLDFANLIDTFNQHNVAFKSTQEQFDTGTPMGNAMLNVTMVFAQLERETIQQRLIDNYTARGKKGCFLGGPAPYGFEKSEIVVDGKRTKTLQMHPEEAQIITQMFELYGNEHCSLSEIARCLNKIQNNNIRKTSWDNVRVSLRLRNPVYVQADADVYDYYKSKGCILENSIEDYFGQHGCFIWGKRRSNDRKYTDLKNHHIAIGLHQGFINSELFIKCQYRLDDNTQIKRGNSGNHTWVSGLIKCGYCGRAMCVGNFKGANNTVVRFLRCSGRAINVCTHKASNIKIDVIEDIVQNELFKVIQSNLHLVNQQPEYTNNDISALQKIQLSKINTQIDNLIKAVAVGDQIVCQYLNAEIARLELEKQKITSEMKKQNMFLYDNSVLQLTDTIRLWDSMSVTDKQKIAQLFIQRIDFTEEEIKIQWRYNFKEDLST